MSVKYTKYNKIDICIYIKETIHRYMIDLIKVLCMIINFNI